MDIQQYVRIVRAHWLLILAFVAVCAGGAAALALVKAPVYAAETQLFVSTRTTGLVAAARVKSYAEIASSLEVAEAVASELGLSESPRDVQEKITATVPEGTVLIDVKVEDQSPELAQEIAEGVGEEFPSLVDSLESPANVPPTKITVTNPAQLPTNPVSAPLAVYLTVGVVLGLLLGLVAAVLREVFDRRIREDDAAEAIADAPILAHIPRDSGAKARPLVVVDDSDSPEAEAYRRLRTNLRPATIDRDRRSVLVTSAVAGEGKTLIAANLAFAFAQAGHRVVIVDADLRRPGLGRLLGIEPTPGLSELLSGEVPEESLYQEHELPLEVLTSGSPPPNPTELLESGAFPALLEKLTSRAEIVILDSPALLPVSDAAIIARRTAAVLMVARVSSTRAEQLDAASEFLRAVGQRPVGAVLNGSPAGVGGAYVYGSNDREKARGRAVPVWDR
jgi:succinoglycan biosynthesis transport protein ExoP